MEKPFLVICVTHMLIEVNLLIQVALIPVITKEFQLSLLEASLIATVPSFVQLLMNVPSGYLYERFGVKHLLFASMLIEGLSGLLVSQTSSFWALVLGISLLKVSSPLYHISGLSQISKLVKPHQMSRSMGFHNALGSLGSAVGVVTLAVFLSTLGWRWTYLFWAFPVLAWGLLLSRSLSPQPERPKKSEVNGKGSMRRLPLVLSSGFVLFLIVVAVREVGATGSSTFMTTFFVNAKFMSESTASLVFGLGPFVGVIGSLCGGYLGERTGVIKALGWTIIGCAGALFILPVIPQFSLIVLAYAIYSFFSNAMWSPMNALVADMLPSTDSGLGFSVYFFTDGATTSIAPTLAAGVIELSGVWFVFPFSAVFLVSSLVILQFLPRYRKRPVRNL
jgi:predicted MFS family arabinose efflux permease